MEPLPLNSPTTPKIAYFITPHGYGHAARAAAVMAALVERSSGVRFEIFTQVPASFFVDSLGNGFGYHAVLTDVGVVQRNSLAEDLPATVGRLDDLLPFAPEVIEGLAGQVVELGCSLVICDIAPLGIAVARAADLPSVLVENFTWDWIYEGYLADEPRLARHLPYLTEMFQATDFHIQTRPVCDPQLVNLVTDPVSRKSRTPAAEIREQLEIPDHARMVMVTMGGGTWDFSFIEQLKRFDDCRFVIAGNGDHLSRTGNVLMLPRHSSYFHPDLVGASDVVIGKVGYSTIAEVYQAGVPFGYVSRSRFRETPPLQRYLEQTLPSVPLHQAAFADGSWLAALPDLLALPRRDAILANGADQIAAFVGQVLSR